jgi:hypothetical protein
MDYRNDHSGRGEAGKRRTSGGAFPLLVAALAPLLLLGGCNGGIDIRGNDNDAFFPFVRVSVPIIRDVPQSGEPSPEAGGARTVPALPQGNLAIDFDAMTVRGHDDDPTRQRDFSLHYEALILRGSTRPRWLGGLYFEGLAGLHRTDLESTSPLGLGLTAKEAGWLIGLGVGYAFSDRMTVHVRSQAGTVGAPGALALDEVMGTYWFNRHTALSAGYRSCEYFNELGIIGFDFRWRGPAAGLALSF